MVVLRPAVLISGGSDANNDGSGLDSEWVVVKIAHLLFVTEGFDGCSLEGVPSKVGANKPHTECQRQEPNSVCTGDKC